MKTYEIDIFHPFSINHISFVMVFKSVLENKTSMWIIQLSFFQVMKYVELAYNSI
jgi:hypothetical protein